MKTLEMWKNYYGTDLYFEPFMGNLNLFLITEDGGIRILDTYSDTPENRAALASVYGAVEVTGWKKGES